MSKNFYELVLEVAKENEKLLRNWRSLAKQVARIVKELYPGARVFVTGSVVRGEAIMGSDIDIVVALPHEPGPREAARIIAHIWERLGPPDTHPVEIHVVSEKQLNMYKELVEIE